MMNKANAEDSFKAERGPAIPLARDPEIAVAEEYEAARRKGTREALELFIARHGDNSSAQHARVQLKRLSR
ncbi:hypothetical protein [Bradyrhizobium japonicum]|uniref:hypothetical protein n=1 Tax=Bradyrhizobium japonicum TaxID=375 RepID=UPI00201392EE|nr:hypothetical protein [Bradyrhizobium japonicum]